MPPTKSAINDLICRYVLQHNIVDEGDLKGALRLQRELLDTGKDDSLENLLVEQKLIKRSQIKSLRYAILYYYLRKADRFYGKIAVQSNICEQGWIDDALMEQKKLNRSKHKLIRLSRILKDKDLINSREDEAIWQAIREIRAQRKKKRKKLKSKAPTAKLDRRRKPKKEEEIPEGVSDEVIEAMDSKDFHAAPGSGRFSPADAESDVEEIESDEELGSDDSEEDIVSDEELEEIISDAELDSGSSEDEADEAPAAKTKAKPKVEAKPKDEEVDEIDSEEIDEIDSEEIDEIDSEEIDDIDSEELDDIDSEELASSEDEVEPASSRSSKSPSKSEGRARNRSKLPRKLTVKRDDSDEG